MSDNPPQPIIEKDIPLPSTKSWHNYPFSEMEVGDSFFVSIDNLPRTNAMIAGSANIRFKPKKFASRKVNHGTTQGRRFWRIA